MQRIWNDPSQATEAKELCGAKAAECLKTLTNPEIRGKDNGQSRKKQERTEYADQIIRPKPTCETRKEMNETKGVALRNGRFYLFFIFY